jgi:uncharacterized protein (TIGR02246 family)
MQARVPLFPVAGILVLALQPGCQVAQQQPAADIHAEENAIRNADIEWSKAAAAKDIDKTVSYYTEDGAMLPPNAPIAAGKPAIRTAWAGMFNMPGFVINWSPARVEVSKSGDLGWSTGTYNLSMNPQGKAVNDHGKYVEVWKKQPDGKWLVAADIANSDMPESGASPAPVQSRALTPPPPQ